MVRLFKKIWNMIYVVPYIVFSYKDYLRYFSDSREYLRLGGKITSYEPIVSDWRAQAGSASGHYFHQDLLVANLVFHNQPLRHIDIGSRLDGFVAHVASFRPIEVMDVRELKNTGHENISFIRANLMEPNDAQKGIADSVSCLHAIEHFGLGRYGDPVDPFGYVEGFKNIVNLLSKNGALYISFPISNSNMVYFNAHRVFEPLDIFKWIEPEMSLLLERFDYVDDNGDLHLNIDIENYKFNLEYGCGIYTFKKFN